MEVSREIRQKLVLVLGNLISRSVDEARNVPYILDQEEEIDLLLRDPGLFEKLVRDEHRHRTEYSKESLTARFDAIGELRQFAALDALDLSFSEAAQSETTLSPLHETIIQISRAFAVYVGNAVTIYEREIHEFLGRYVQVLRESGWPMGPVSLKAEDMQGLEQRVEKLLEKGEYLQAFSHDRLLASTAITGEVVRLPAGYSLARILISRTPVEGDAFARMARFVVRAAYISHGVWQDLFGYLVNAVGQGRESPKRALLVDLIEADAVFSCSLLCQPHSVLARLSRDERKAAIERNLADWASGCRVG